MAALKSATKVNVTHLDASKAAVQWARQNVALSGVESNDRRVRWIVDNCTTFLNREIKRGNTYDGLIFDPPAFGRFNGKMWKIKKDFHALIEIIPKLLNTTASTPKFVILSCHDEKFPKERIKELLQDSLKGCGIMGGRFEMFDMILRASLIDEHGLKGKDLPCGSCVRWIVT